MASVTITTASWQAEIDVPDAEQVTLSLAYDVIFNTVLLEYQLIAADVDAEDRTTKMEALSALLLAIRAEQASLLPALTLTPE